MDPIAHTFVGAALAQTGLGRRTAYGTAVLVIGANLPDVDGLAMLIDGDTALLFRRGWTHGLLAVAMLPVLLALFVAGFHKLTSRASESTGPPFRMDVILGLSYLAVGTHPSLDWLNNYGMRWLMPFEGRWFYGDSLYIVDPWIWIVLGGSLFLFHSRRWWSVAGWSLFAALAGALLVLFVPGLVWAKLLCLAILVAFIVARFRGIGLEVEQSRRIAIGALCLTGLYIAGMVTSVQYARNAVAEALRQEGMEIVQLMVSPVRVTPFERDIVIQTPRDYRYGGARLFPRFEIELDPRSIPLLANTAVVRAATKSPNARGFMNWARFPYAEVDEHEEDYEVYLLDARYMRSRDRGFGVARVIVPKDTLGD